MGLFKINTYSKKITINGTEYNWSDSIIQSKHEGGYYYFDLTNTSIWGTGTKYVKTFQGTGTSEEYAVTAYAIQNAVAFGMEYR